MSCFMIECNAYKTGKNKQTKNKGVNTQNKQNQNFKKPIKTELKL